MIPSKQNSAKVLAPTGTFVARVIEILYLGTTTSPYKDDAGNAKQISEVRLKWELPTKLHVFKEGEGAKPFVVSKKMTFSMFKKATLRPFVEAALGVSLKDEEADKFDIDEVMGKTCLLSVDKDENDFGTFNVVKSAIPLPEGTIVPLQVNASRIISFEKWNEEAFQNLPDFLRKRIEASKEYQEMKFGKKSADPRVDAVDSSEIPF